MAVPVSQAWTVATYVLKQKLKGRKQYPLVLMLEPLFRCNLACAGCGKIQYPAHILKAELTPEECFKAVEECGTPMVAIPGGEPLLHPQMPEIVAGLVARKKYVYMCTNALLLKEKLHLFKPSKYLSFSVHVDGQREHHDFSVCREGGYDIAMEGVRAAVAAGFRVTTNTTLFDGADPNSVRAHFDEMMVAGVESMMVSPGYTYDKAPDQKHFLGRAQVEQDVPRHSLEPQEDVAVQHLSALHGVPDGQEELDCTPWGMPTFSIFGWQKPCYLLQDGYADTFKELMETTEWPNYGTESGNPQCANCMVHSGYEASGVDYTFGSFKGFLADGEEVHVPSSYEDEGALKLLNEWKPGARWPAGADCRPRRYRRQRAAVSLRRLTHGDRAAGASEDGAAAAARAPTRWNTSQAASGKSLRAGFRRWPRDAEIREALEKAFDYRGDITITRKDGSQVVGYLFDRRAGSSLADSFVRIIPSNAPTKVNIAYSDIAALAFTGRDTAAGKTFEAWVKKYWEKKAAGERNIQIEPEKLD